MDSHGLHIGIANIRMIIARVTVDTLSVVMGMVFLNYRCMTLMLFPSTSNIVTRMMIRARKELTTAAIKRMALLNTITKLMAIVRRIARALLTDHPIKALD